MPSPIPAIEIDSIRLLIDSELSYDPCPLIKEGEMVEVKSGPLKGVVGRLVRKGAHARLVLSVDLIGQAVSVEVDAADVKAVLISEAQGSDEDRQNRMRVRSSRRWSSRRWRA